jgi:serine/threonine protein kinase
MALKPDDILLDRYTIQALLGQGGMGAVYRAHDSLHDQLVALKQFLLAHLPSTEEIMQQPTEERDTSVLTRDKAVKQFRREAQLLARLDHPNLPKVTDYFALDNDCFLVMTLIEGRDLAKMLRENNNQPLPLQFCLHIMDQIMNAMAYCHQQNVIHRDIKPSNIILREDGHAFLVDFGIAKPAESGQTTSTGARALTPGYSPLEQYGGGHTDARSDIYSLGATLYALLTGSEPRPAYERVTQGEMTPPSQLLPIIPPHVSFAVMRSVAITPEDRFKTIAEFRTALKLPTSGVPAVVPPPLYPQAGQTPPAIPVRPISKPPVAMQPGTPISYPPRTPYPAPPPLTPEQLVSQLRRQKWERALKIGLPILVFIVAVLIIILIGGSQMGWFGAPLP